MSTCRHSQLRKHASNIIVDLNNANRLPRFENNVDVADEGHFAIRERENIFNFRASAAAKGIRISLAKCKTCQRKHLVS